VNLKSSLHRTGLIAAIAALALLGACSSPPDKGGGEQASKAANATSVADFGGLDGLVAAAKQEGNLNVIALPPDWANYGKMISGFSAKYGIKITSAQPDASSQDEINAANQLKGTSRAPDVFDVGLNIALANTGLFAPYKVQGWNDIPDALKESSGKWFSDYGGYMSIGYDAGKVPAPTSMKDLLKPAYKGKVALNGDPTQAAAAFNGVVAAALDNGGSADDIAPGVQFFADLKKAGNFLPVDPTPATVESGQTPVVIDWDYLNAGQAEKLKGKIDWKVVVPKNAVVGSYYVQAINKDAPHPAAARLWEEYLFSDEGQNIWLAGSARPIRADAMVKAGTIDRAAYSKLPAVSGTPVYLTEAQTNAAKEYLAAHWTQAVG
jgi:putative spermidine/putrescine transport system substrate-binding protein